MTKKFFQICLALVAGALFVSCAEQQVQEVPQTKELIVIESQNLKCNDSVLVFTPIQYASNKTQTLPTLFLLHGWSGCYKDWSNKHDIQEISNRTGF